MKKIVYRKMGLAVNKHFNTDKNHFFSISHPFKEFNSKIKGYNFINSI